MLSTSENPAGGLVALVVTGAVPLVQHLRADHGQPGDGALAQEDTVGIGDDEAAVEREPGRRDVGAIDRDAGTPFDRVVRERGDGRHGAQATRSYRMGAGE
jgi:hypothetical protein